MADTDLQNFIINKLTQTQFDGATKDPNQLYIVTDSNKYQEKLIAGTNITIDENTNVISASNELLPSQEGNLGKFLTTNGTELSWTSPRLYNIFDHKWADHLLFDIRWLRADNFTWQYATAYITAYEHLLKDGSSQSVQYTFVNNVLTLLAGSVICVPDGFETNGLTKKYTNITLAEDTVISVHAETNDWVGYLCYNTSRSQFELYDTLIVEDETLIPVTDKCLFYDKVSNKMKLYDGGVFSDEYHAFPLMYITSSSTAITGISEVYNGVKVIDRDTETFNGVTVVFYRAEDGHKICLADQEINISNVFSFTGTAWYYLLDTANRRFKLPRTIHGNIGFRDKVGDAVIDKQTNVALDLSEQVTVVNEQGTQNYLYFYIGDFTETATQQTASLNTALFNGKQDNLVNTVNIKSINGNSLLGSGNLEVSPTGVSLFDTKWTDHLLDDMSWLRTDTFSWHDGTVYSDLYNHLVTDMSTATSTEIYDSSNVSLVGGLVNNQGILSGFTSNTSYASLPTITAPITSFEFVVKVHTPNTFTAQGDIVNCTSDYKGMIVRVSTAGAITWWVSANGTSWNIASGAATGLTLSVNTDYYIKITWDGAQYVISYSTDGETYVSGTAVSNTKPLNLSSLIQLGGGRNSNPWLSTIDIRNAYIKVDDVEVWHGINTHIEHVAEDGHRFVEESVALNKYIEKGVAWYYVLDTTNQRFKLPRTKYSFTGFNNTVGNLSPVLSGTGFPKISKNRTTISADTNYTLSEDCWVWWGNNSYVGRRYFYVNGIEIGQSYGSSGNWEEFNSLLIPLRAGNTIKHTGGNSICYIYPVENNNLDTQMYLYMYAGEFTQGALKQTAGLNSRLFANKVDLDGNNATFSHIIEKQDPTAENNYTWYRKYSDGWVEQGGIISTDIDAQFIQTLPVIMNDSNYSVQVTRITNAVYSTTINGAWCLVWNRTTTSFTTWGKYASFPQSSWRVEGKFAQ